MNAYFLTQVPLLAGFGLLLLVASLWPRHERLSHAITVAALALCAVLTALKLVPGQEFFGGAIRVTATGKFLAYAGLGFALISVILAEDYLPKLKVHGTDFRILALAQALGVFHLPLAGDLATLFIAFELVSIPSYVLAGFNHRDARANEAGMKYLVLGIFASSLFLLGFAFLYGATGEFRLDAIQEKLGRLVAEGSAPDLVLAKMALLFLLAALLFKTGSAPLHFWLPDVYEGSNLASLAFLAVPAKLASFGLLAFLLWGPFASLHAVWKPVLIAVAACCAVFGNLQALAQTRLKRLLAYSAVANAGFILLSLLLDSPGAFLFYLVSYGLTTLGVIAALMVLGTQNSDVDDIADLNGLGKRHSWVAGGLTLALFSLAGIPLTAGFAAKFAVVSGALKPGLFMPRGFFPILVLSVGTGLISFFFYFKIVRALWLPAEDGVSISPDLPRSPSLNFRFVLAFCAAAILALGILMRLPGLPTSF